MEYWLYHTQWLGNSTLAWLIAAAGALFGYIVVHSAAAIIAAHLRKLAERRPRASLKVAAAVVAATRGWLLLLLAIVIAADFLHFDTRPEHWLQQLTFALVGLQLALWLTRLIVVWLQQSTNQDSTQRGNPIMLGILTWAAQFVVWVTLAMALLANGGVNITAFVASLGIGGVAVALALQNVLGDLFASISIGLDKPFVVGEFIAFGTDLGTVTRVGVKTTRIASLSGEELAISNSNLLKQLVHNYTRMQKRRVVFGFGVPYDTPSDKVQSIVEHVRQFITDEDKTTLDRGHFRGFGDSGLTFEFVYYVLDPGYTLYCDIQQSINIKIVDYMVELGIDFAVPAQSVRVKSLPDNAGTAVTIAAAAAPPSP